MLLKNVLRELMDKYRHGLSAYRLAEMVNKTFSGMGDNFVSPQSIGRWLQGKHKTVRNEWQLVAMAHVLECSEAETTRLLRAGGHTETLYDLLPNPLAKTFFRPNWQPAPPTVAGRIALLMDVRTKPPPTLLLPAEHRMIYRRNNHFVGRDAELRRIVDVMNQGQTIAARSVTVTGVAGMGKTQLAVEFAYQSGHSFPGGVFWLDFADANRIPDEVKACGQEGMNLPGLDNLTLTDAVRRVRAEWDKPDPRLLIFDNCDYDNANEVVSKWLPKTGGCCVLITSRHSQWDPALGLTTIPVTTLTRTDSQKLLSRLAFRLTPDETNLVAEELGDFPLALHLAGAFLRHYPATAVSTYLAELREDRLRHSSLQGWGDWQSPTGHVQNVARTFMVSWYRLQPDDDVDELAKRLMACMVGMAPGVPVPGDRLQEMVAYESDEGIDPYLWQNAQWRLVNLGLVEGEPNFLRIHRLVQAFVLGEAS